MRKHLENCDVSLLHLAYIREWQSTCNTAYRKKIDLWDVTFVATARCQVIAKSRSSILFAASFSTKWFCTIVTNRIDCVWYSSWLFSRPRNVVNVLDNVQMKIHVYILCWCRVWLRYVGVDYYIDNGWQVRHDSCVRNGHTLRTGNLSY
jgi:hypothetical protein